MQGTVLTYSCRGCKRDTTSRTARLTIWPRETLLTSPLVYDRASRMVTHIHGLPGFPYGALAAILANEICKARFVLRTRLHARLLILPT